MNQALMIVGLVMLLIGAVFLTVGMREKRRPSRFGKWLMSRFINETPGELIRISLIFIFLGVVSLTPLVWKFIVLPVWHLVF